MSEPAPPAETGQAPRGSRPWPRRLGWIRGALLIAVGAELLYLVLAHAFLLSPLARNTINRRPHRLVVEWHLALSPLPGLVRVTGLELRGQNRRARWQAEVERAWLTVDLFRLSRKRFVSSWTRVDGAALRVDPARPPGSDTPSGGTLPPIPELAPAPAGSEAPPARPPKRRWRIELRDLEASRLRDVWIGRSRARGDGTLHVDLRYQLRGELSLDEVSIDLRGGALEFAGAEVARAVDLESTFAAPPFVPREIGGRALLESLRGEVDLEAEVKSAGFLRRLLRGQPWLELDGEGQLATRFGFDRGELKPGSRLRLDADPVVASLFGQPATGTAVVVVRRDLGADHTTLEALFERFVFGSEEATLVEGAGLAVSLESAATHLFRPLEIRAADVELPRSPMRDLRALDAFLPPAVDMGFDSGTGEVGGQLHYRAEEGTGKGELQLQLRDVRGHFQETALRGELELRALLTGVDLEKGTMNLAGSELRLDRVAVLRSGEPPAAPAQTGWWGRARLGDTKLLLGPPLELDGTAALRLRDSGPVVALLAEQRPWLRWVDALLTVEDVAGQLEWRVDPAGIELRALEVTAPPIEIRAALRLAESRRTGVVYLGYRGLDAAFELRPDGGRDWQLTHPRRWYAARAEAFLAGKPAATGR